MKKPLWLKQLREATFRDVKFFVDSSTDSFGRRTVSHEFPMRDKPFTEDLGRRQQTFTIEGYVIGDTYFAQRDKLIAACEKAGPGELVHPYLGAKNVICTQCSVTESRDEGGVARFSLSFAEAGGADQPRVSADQAFALNAAADGLSAAAGNDFLLGFDVIGAPDAVVTRALSLVNKAGDMLDITANGIPGRSTKLARLLYTIKKLKGDAANLVSSPSLLRSSLADVFKQFASALSLAAILGDDDVVQSTRGTSRAETRAAQAEVTRRASTTTSAIGAFGAGIPLPAATTPSGLRSARVQNSLARYIQTEALVTRTRVTSQGVFLTKNDVAAERDALVGMIDELVAAPVIETDVAARSTAQAPFSDQTYIALHALRDAVVRRMADTDATAVLSTYFLRQTSPLLAVLYDLYGTLEFESDVTARNNVSHPGFLFGGRTYEVISDV
jgi:prophage DNA circulation protein